MSDAGLSILMVRSFGWVVRLSLPVKRCASITGKYLSEMTQIATTLEQSKRLIAAGFNPRSCDMRWTNEVEKDEGWGFIITEEEEEYHLELGQPFFDFPSDPSIPAWSLARLWDMYSLRCGREFMITSVPAKELFEVLIERLI